MDGCWLYFIKFILKLLKRKTVLFSFDNLSSRLLIIVTKFIKVHMRMINASRDNICFLWIKTPVNIDSNSFDSVVQVLIIAPKFLSDTVT